MLKRVQIIDINGIKHAAEYLNSSKVKYDDDVIDIRQEQTFQRKKVVFSS